MALQLWATRFGVALIDGPIFTALSGEIVLTELGQFSKSTVVLPASDRRVLSALAPYTLIEVVQDDLITADPNDPGTLTFGYVLNPSQQISQNADHTITLELEPLTVEATWRLTRRGWIAANKLSVVAARIGALVTADAAHGLPGWTGVYTDAATSDPTVSVTLNSPTALAGFIDTAQRFDQLVRQGVDVYGAPTRVLEMGQFGSGPTIWLTSANGAGADEMTRNTTTRLITTVDRQPNNVENLVNVCVPFGGGANDTLVTLERLWRIINDPTYINFGRWGSDAQSIAQTGQPSLFPEYDPAYPISDPEHPPLGGAQFSVTFPGTTTPVPMPAGYAVAYGARQSDGTVPITLSDPTGHVVVGAAVTLQQGYFGTRGVTLDGHFDYLVYDAVSYATYGHKEGTFIDSSLTYADNSVANQELTARALYVETVTNFKRYAHPHHTFTCTTPGLARPERAGNLVAVDFQRMSVREDGAVIEMDVTENLKVTSVVRTFTAVSGSTETPPMDRYQLSNLGRFDQDDATAQAAQAKTMIALQLNQGTSIAPLSIADRGNVDAAHPLVKHISVPKQLFRWQRCNLRVDFLPYTATSTTAQNPTGDYIVSADVDVTLTTPNDINLGGTFNSDGTGATGTTDGFSTNLFVHVYGESSTTGATTGTGTFPNSGGAQAFGRDGNSIDVPVYRRTGANNPGLDTATTKSTFTAPIHKQVAAAGDTIAHIKGGQRLAPLTLHTHPVDQRIPDGPLPVSCLVDINGQFLSSGLVLLSGARDLSGAFTGSFEVDDISPMLNGLIGSDLTITLHPGTSAGNQYGVGMYVLSGTWLGEFGGLQSTVRAT